MRPLLIRLILIPLLLSIFGLAALVWYSLEAQPRVLQGSRLSEQDMASARRVIERYAPETPPGERRYQLHLNQRDLNLAANYLLQRYGGTTAVVIETGRAYVDATAHLPGLPIRSYLNVSLEIREDAGMPRLSWLRIGRLAVPDPIARLLLREMVKGLSSSDGPGRAVASVQEIRLRPGRLSVLYAW